ncbi:DUF2802 domain-containing protein [Nitrogeniibacter mangrovi]|uniref:DUF2802 domain-containing protein n=1 Tax=Nitrogeniibacter mangrovi TaxID=2016596 RepID=A0A6C1B3G2_9RHOO|nr:DUF2802 domain-containing protein [Nitrogeniibacter mangrovi]QID16744.1 DUF2802 domain-containing protein [Nitrogeniibacter mangrovi]
MGAREWVFAAVAILAVYLVFQLIRALQVKDAPADAVDDEDEDGAEADADGEADFERLLAVDDDPDAASPPAAAAGQGASQESEDSFGLALEIRQLRRDVAQLREELDTQRGELTALRALVDGQAQAIEAARAAQRVSPIYGEALSLAQRGMSADVIAERCSISVAEAELVQSLAQDSASSGETP